MDPVAEASGPFQMGGRLHSEFARVHLEPILCSSSEKFPVPLAATQAPKHDRSTSMLATGEMRKWRKCGGEEAKKKKKFTLACYFYFITNLIIFFICDAVILIAILLMTFLICDAVAIVKHFVLMCYLNTF